MENIFIGLHGADSPYYNNLNNFTFDRTIDLSEKVNELPISLKDLNQIKTNPPPISFSKSNSYYFDNDGIQEILDPIVTEGNLFFVESNSAHHISYFLAKNAFKNCPPNCKKAVLNFDQHLDYGISYSPVENLFCGNWGGTLRNETADYFVEGKYCQSENVVISFQEKNGQRIDADKINEELKAYEYVYVSVDMDVLLKVDKNFKRTNWPDGGMDIDTLKQYIDSRLNGVNVIAADITGFPFKTEEWELRNKEKRKVFDTFTQNIIDVANALQRHIRAAQPQ